MAEFCFLPNWWGKNMSLGIKEKKKKYICHYYVMEGKKIEEGKKEREEESERNTRIFTLNWEGKKICSKSGKKKFVPPEFVMQGRQINKKESREGVRVVFPVKMIQEKYVTEQEYLLRKEGKSTEGNKDRETSKSQSCFVFLTAYFSNL